MPIQLLNSQASSGAEVIALLADTSTDWAEKTNEWTVKYVQQLTETYGDRWQKGLLPEEYFFSILLPEHAHCLAEDASVPRTFGYDTPIANAVTLFDEESALYYSECRMHIQHLRNEIRDHGFTSTVLLAVIDGKLRHVDGLHRLIALGSLIHAGYAYQPIWVVVCNC